MNPKNILVIYNPIAGWRRRRRLDKFVSLLKDDKCTVTILETKARGDAEKFASKVFEMNFDCVVAAGGDGTINEVVNGLARVELNRHIPLAILPLGTANVFAMEIGLTTKIRECASVIVSGIKKDIYLGKMNDRLFIQMAGIGFDAQVVADVSPLLKRRFGKLAYIFKSLLGFFCYSLPVYVISIDGINHVAASVVIANGHFYGGKFICASSASVFNNDLKVCLFESSGGWNAFRYAFGLVRGRLQFYPDVSIISGKHLRVSGGENQPVQADGDVVSDLPIEIEAGSAQISVLVQR